MVTVRSAVCVACVLHCWSVLRVCLNGEGPERLDGVARHLDETAWLLGLMYVSTRS